MAMANSLLDFVMSLVRDPDAAARYAADPAQAIADAHLTDVTSADVQNLIPVVSESLSMSMPSYGLDAFDADQGDNVWASGAATAAFDAFDDHLPHSVIVDPDDAVPDVVGQGDPAIDAFTGADLVESTTSLQLDVPTLEDAGTTEPGLTDDWAQPLADHAAVDHTPGFDLFD